MGAVLKILYDQRQGRVQSIGHRLRVFPLFHHENSYQNFEAVVTVFHGSSTTEYRNLFVADLTITNRSNRDFGDFEFGVTLQGDQEDRCIHVAWEDPDQHHSLSLVEPVSPSAPKASLKVLAKPFNRRDSYSLRLYLTSARPGGEPGIPKLTSPHSIRFFDEVGQGVRRHNLVSWSLTLLSLLVALASWFMPVSVFERQPRLLQVNPANVEFANRLPFPLHFEHVVPGMKLSDVRSAMPQGRVTSSGYIVKIESGPFSHVAYAFFPEGNDPSIQGVLFFFRDYDSKQAVLGAALEAFGNVHHVSEVQGTRLTWPDINGFKLTLDDIYSIVQAEEELPPNKIGRADD